jgi:hypothetical protein
MVTAIVKSSTVISNYSVLSDGIQASISRKVSRLTCSVIKNYKLLSTQNTVLIILIFILHQSLMKREVFYS